jgi:uncharacterized protein
MIIAISGSTGFIGKQLSDWLLQSGNELIVISRDDFADGSNQLAKVINSADVIINLAGAPVLQRWNEKNKQLILSSRVDTTRLLVEAVQQNLPVHRPKVFISASVIGIYNDSDTHDEISMTSKSQTEDDPPVGGMAIPYDLKKNRLFADEFSTPLGTDFLARVCKAWERETVALKEIDLRLCTVRIGIVLGTTGGSLAKMLPIFKAGLGGSIGSGKQPFLFIHISDFCRAIEHLIMHQSSTGVYNLVSPELITNGQFTSVLSGCMHRHAFFTVPEFALKLIYGEASKMLAKGAFVNPTRLLDEGFQFQFPDISSALTDLTQKSV